MAYTCWAPQARMWMMLPSTAATRMACNCWGLAWSGPTWHPQGPTPSLSTPSRTQTHLYSTRRPTSCLPATRQSSRPAGSATVSVALLAGVCTALVTRQHIMHWAQQLSCGSSLCNSKLIGWRRLIFPCLHETGAFCSPFRQDATQLLGCPDPGAMIRHSETMLDEAFLMPGCSCIGSCLVSRVACKLKCCA